MVGHRRDGVAVLIRCCSTIERLGRCSVKKAVATSKETSQGQPRYVSSSWWYRLTDWLSRSHSQLKIVEPGVTQLCPSPAWI